MKAGEIISELIEELELNTSISRALDYADVNRLSHLPLVQHNKLIGMLSETNLLTEFDEQTSIEKVSFSPEIFFVYDTDHLFEVVKRFGEVKTNVIPVISAEQEFLGCILLEDVMQVIAKMPVIESQGSILVLELNIRDYSLTEIARLVESNDAKILGSFITRSPDSAMIELTLKINQTDIRAVAQTLERFNYNITGSYDKGDVHDDMKQRYDALMNYLNM